MGVDHTYMGYLIRVFKLPLSQPVDSSNLPKQICPNDINIGTSVDHSLCWDSLDMYWNCSEFATPVFHSYLPYFSILIR